MTKKRSVNYLNNRDIIAEIHKSKNTYCQFNDPIYKDYDAIVENFDVVVDKETCKEHTGLDYDEWIYNIKKNKAKKLNKDENTKKYSAEDFSIEDLVFRWMTYDHIPLDPEWPEDKPKKKVSDGHMKVNFPPFQHYILVNGTPKCVGFSHYDKHGNFNTEHGNITPKLGKMYMLLVEKISKKSNWRNYTYIDEMKSSALVQLSFVGLQFNEARGNTLNPFAFYTTVVNNAFKRVLNNEKRMRDIRDDLLEMSGQNPSMTRQVETSENYDNELNKSWHSPNAELKNSKS